MHRITHGDGKTLDGGATAGIMKKIFEKTMGDILWCTIIELKGWKLEKHILTGDYRIVNRDGITIIWGNQDCIRKSFGRIVEYDMDKDRIGWQ